MQRYQHKSGKPLKFSSKEKTIYDAMKEGFINKDEACVACLTIKHWDIEFNSDFWAFYERKTRKLISYLVYEFSRIPAKEVFPDVPEENKLRFITVKRCPYHKQFRNYKLVHAAEEWEIVHARSVSRQEGMRVAHEQRVEESVRQYPVFKKRLKYIKVEVPYLFSERSKNEKK